MFSRVMDVTHDRQLRQNALPGEETPFRTQSFVRAGLTYYT